MNEESVINFWKNKKVLITGGSAGLGFHLALQLADWGARVAIVGRTKEKLNRVKELAPDIVIIQADVSRKEDSYKISMQAFAGLEGVDVVFNNASSLGITPLQFLLDTECETLSEVLETNLLGPFRLIKALLPSMLFNGFGLVVNVSSDAAVNSYERWGAYSVSKAALDHLTRIWHQELCAEGIHFVAIDPGDMNTDLHRIAIPDADFLNLHDPKEVARDMLSFLAMHVTSNSENKPVRYSAGEWRRML